MSKWIAQRLTLEISGFINIQYIYTIFTHCTFYSPVQKQSTTHFHFEQYKQTITTIEKFDTFGLILNSIVLL